MADRDSFSLDGSMDGIDLSKTAEVAKADLDNYLNSDPDDLSVIPKTKKAQQPQSPKNQSVKKTPLKKEKIDDEDDDQEEEEDFMTVKSENEAYMDRLLGIEKEESDNEDTEENDSEESTNPQAKQSEAETPENEEPETNVYQDYADEMLELGIFTLDEGEEGITITSSEELADRHKREAKKTAAMTLEKFIARFGADRQEAFDAIYVHGVDPREYFESTFKVEDIESLDLTKEGNQRKVLEQHYKSLGWDDTKVASKIQKLADYGDLEDEANDIHAVLVQREKDNKEQLVYNQQQENARKAAQKQTYVKSINQILSSKLQSKEFDGIPLDQNFAQQTYNFLTQDRYTTSDGEVLTEFEKNLLELKKPENFEKRVKVAMLIQLLETDPTLSKIKKAAVSKEANETFKRLKKHNEKQKTALDRRREDDQITSFI